MGNALCVEAISAYLLEDGIVDDEKAKWLPSKIQGDGQLDKTERTLLVNLKNNTKKFLVILDLVK